MQSPQPLHPVDQNFQVATSSSQDVPLITTVAPPGPQILHQTTIPVIQQPQPQVIYLQPIPAAEFIVVRKKNPIVQLVEFKS